MNQELLILQYSYWEHFKGAKELALILPVNHPRRVEMEYEVNKIQKQIDEIRKGETK